MAQLIFNVKNQWIRREDSFKPVAKSKNYLYAKFKFLSEEWTGTPTALFSDSQNTYTVLIDQNGECLVPWEVIHGDERNFTVSVFCGDLVTANKLKIRLYESGYTDDAESETPPTPSVYNQIIERMDGVEQTVVDSAEAAAGSASSASASAGAAAGSAAQAAESASAAGTSAQAALSAASSAGQKATAAAGSASESASKASEAAASATAAAGSASAAAASAGEAATKAGEAASSATEGINAKNAAISAKNDAVNAKLAAETAVEHYPRIVNDYWQLWDPEDEEWVDTGVKAEGTDGLNGYSPTVTVTEITGGHRVVITDKNGSHTFDVMDGSDATVTVDDELDDQSENPVQNKVITEEVLDLKAEISHLQTGKADIIITSASGTVASFSDGAEYDAVGLTAEFAPYQEGSGDPSPTNVRPIHGWTGLDVTACGRNIFNKNNPDIINGYIATDFIDTSSYSKSICVRVKENSKYTISKIASSRFSTAFSTLESMPTVGTAMTNVYVEHTATRIVRTSPTGAKWLVIWLYASNFDTLSLTDILNTVQVVEGDVEIPYEQYHGTTTPISWQTEAGEVFGGYVDVVRNKVVKTFDKLIINTTTRPDNKIIKLDDGRIVIFTDGLMKRGASQVGWCNVLPNFRDVESAVPNVQFGIGNTNIVLNNTIWESLEAFKTYIDNNVFEVVYPLATPIEYDITPATIELLKGYNNVWSSAGGNVDVDYRADTKLYLEAHAPKVDDVQVNGTSVVSQGVADIPIADDSTLGLVMTNSGAGIDINPDTHKLRISSANGSNVRSGSEQYKPIVPSNQHTATFYGLAKVAGYNESGNTNPGQYTDAAKIAIQKMLGIYEAPWELIREDTVTNATEADIDITVDSNGQPFELTDIRFVFQTPQQDVQASVGTYGRVRIYFDNSSNDIIYLGAYTQAANTQQRTGMLAIEQRGNMIQRIALKTAGNNSDINITGRNNFDFTSHNSFWEYVAQQRVYNKIKIEAVTGTATYKLYGKRKWS